MKKAERNNTVHKDPEVYLPVVVETNLNDIIKKSLSERVGKALAQWVVIGQSEVSKCAL